MAALLSRTLAIYIATASLFGAIAVRGFLVPLRAHELGASRATVGLLFTAFTISGALLAIPAGQLADRFGRRRTVVASAVVTGVSQLLIGVTADVLGYEILQVVGGLGVGAAQAALFAAAADSAPDRQVGSTMGWMTLAIQAGFLSGPGLAGVLLTWTSVRTALIASSLLCAVPIALVAFLPSISKAAAGDRPGMLQALRQLSTRTGFYPLIVGMTGATLTWGTSQAYLPLIGTEAMGLSGGVIGIVVALQAVANGGARVPAGRLVDRVAHPGRLVAGGTAIYALAVALIPHMPSAAALAVLLMVATPGAATAFIAVSVIFSDLSDERTRGLTMGVYSAFLLLGNSIGPLAFGPLIQDRGYGIGFAACAVAGGALGMAMLFTRYRAVSHAAPALPSAAAGR